MVVRSPTRIREASNTCEHSRQESQTVGATRCEGREYGQNAKEFLARTPRSRRDREMRMYRNQLPARRAAFLLMEVIVGAVAVGMLTSLFYTSIHMMRGMEQRIMRQSQAIRVLDNTLERARAVSGRGLRLLRRFWPMSSKPAESPGQLP